MVFAIIMIIIGTIVAMGAIVVFALKFKNSYDRGELTFFSVAALVIGLLIAGGSAFWLYGTESGARSIRSFHSETTGGLSREVRVYDMEGDLIEQYEGKFDVEITDGKILFDMPSTDGSPKRIQVLHSTGTVVIEEK